MTKAVYFDVFAGASGDMILGALIDAGADLDELRDALSTLPIEGWTLVESEERRGVLTGTRIRVEVDPAVTQPARTRDDITGLIAASGLPDRVKRDAWKVFALLAEAEGAVHRVPAAQVHFHEVGAIDSIIDIVGAIVALDLLNVEEIFVSPIPLGGGMAKASHGTIPVPAPATIELLTRAGAPVRASSGSAAEKEMVTPTAAAIFAALGTFSLPRLQLQGSGYGIGGWDLPDQSNALRVLIGEVPEEKPDDLRLLETNIDDMSPEIFGYVLDRLFSVGVRDAWFSPIQMKKNRPATKISVIVEAAMESEVANLLLEETSTLGVRVMPITRYEAGRRTAVVETPLGPATIKIKVLNGEVSGFSPEYESCLALADRHGLPLRDVYLLVESIARSSDLSSQKTPERMPAQGDRR